MNLQQWRQKHDVHLNQVARDVGMDGGHLSKFERGLAQISPENAAKIIRYTNGEVTWEDLFGDPMSSQAA